MSASPNGSSPTVTTSAFRARKGGEPLVVVTACDAPSARLAAAAGVDALLVGDSLGMTVLGFDSTLPVTMDDMVRHTAAVRRGAPDAFVIADMPFLSFQVSVADTMRNAGRLLAEAGAAAVKLEGASDTVLEAVDALTQAGIPVMGHVGLTPQSVHQLGGYKVQARETEAALLLLDDCRALENAGAFAVVLECIPAELAALVTAEVGIPTIGIGAGERCDGQVQVFHDLLGLGERTPRHAQRYADVGALVTEAIGRYVADVRAGAFPRDPHCTRIDPTVLAEITEAAMAGNEG